MNELTPQQVLDRLNDAQVIDVRETEEVADGMIVGARHIPLAQVPGSTGLLDKTRPVIAVCRSGRRSAAAAEQLAAAGFTAYTMSGGMLDWKASGLATTAPPAPH
ncbi:rhodanese-like domain-containing protein [Cryobacterium sp. Sr8]|uniref:Rhodanese-related sulfurtransferase n=1 Tax=Cryobacterium psychrotolerans TaxID=386301 RepID=A0A1G9GS98_9MICO|nr:MULTISPECIES: rhodanese-like domain-containing protein [Cryobacterium]TFD74153.1 rhodanese-like domain-containing protein [Cryobacterium sp. Sr8]TFD86763.1 rhodanese-like domain-containing protein [Cryobacterium psychrotolerans]SDL03547.1 Rhodanese-related sulfurtransferase [Cryobacterium psychrotolerans]